MRRPLRALAILTGFSLGLGVVAGSPPPAAAADIGGLAGIGARPGATQLPFTAGDSVQAQVDVGSGNLMVTVRGLAISGVQGNVNVDAWYNSLAFGTFFTDLGAGWGLDYTSDVQLETESDDSITYYGPGGLTYNFPLVQNSRTAYVSAPGSKSTLVGDDDGWTLTNRESQEERTFDTEGRLVEVVDRNDNPVTIDIDGDEETITAGSSDGSFTRAGRTAVMSNDGGLTTLTQSTPSGSRSVRFTHNLDTMTEFRDALGRVTSFRYEAAGTRLVDIIAPGGVQTTFDYDAQGRISEVRQLESSGDGPGNSVTRLAYPSGSRTLVADPTTDLDDDVADVPHTAYTLDASDRVTQVVDAEGRTRSRTYTPSFDVATSTNSTGAGAATTVNDYGANGGESLTRTVSPTGARSSLAYATADPNQYLASGGADSAGNPSTYTYNGAGNQLTSTDANASQASVTYRATGNVASATTPGNGSNRTNYRTSSGLLSSIGPVTGSSLGERRFTYDTFGRVTTATNGRGITTTYRYDDLDRTTALEHSDGTSTTFGYDAAGRNDTRVDTWGTTSYGYDQLGRLVSRANSAGGGTIDYTYDKASRLTSSTSPGGGTVTYDYDDSGMPIGIDYPAASGSGTERLAFRVDSKGRRAGTFLNSSADRTEWSVRTLITYDRSDRPTGLTVDRGTGNDDYTRITDTSYCYAAGTSLTSCSTETSTNRAKLRWRKDNLTGVLTTYAYDRAGRLVDAEVRGSGARTYEYTYNAAGSRTSAARTGRPTQNLTFNPANQISTAGYEYDGAGNLTDDPNIGRNFLYTAGDQLRTINTTSGNRYQYRYAGIGNNELVYQTTPEGTYQYTYGRTNFAGVPIVEDVETNDGTASVISDPVTGQPLMLRTSDGTQSLYINENSVGSAIGLIDSEGREQFAYDYDPFGMKTLDQDSGGEAVNQNPYLFASGVQDRTTGWTKFGTRYYDARTGAFTQRDTLDAPLDPLNGNRYAYAGADPINNVDPTGNLTEAQTDCLIGVGVQAIGTYALIQTGITLGAAATAGALATRQAAPLRLYPYAGDLILGGAAYAGGTYLTAKSCAGQF